jgi:hypothetical protein
MWREVIILNTNCLVARTRLKTKKKVATCERNVSRCGKIHPHVRRK